MPEKKKLSPLTAVKDFISVFKIFFVLDALAFLILFVFFPDKLKNLDLIGLFYNALLMSILAAIGSHWSRRNAVDVSTVCPDCALSLLPDTEFCPRCGKQEPFKDQIDCPTCVYLLPFTYIKGRTVDKDTIADEQTRLENGLKAMGFQERHFINETAFVRIGKKRVSLWVRILYKNSFVVLCAFKGKKDQYSTIYHGPYARRSTADYDALVALANGDDRQQEAVSVPLLP